ncbi:uncharacterized protein si:dkey-22i16.7 [Neoarius graeffei]|uniref:uncharacterized protein si:dkey-22i16.7 n=1 Tax=Neoarius graeffei TaxID=443677 RepID=UPI00298C2D57|nr:uncharacterized protein si:dkey-22i16.7 [Neoarius graeffei]
MKIVLVFIAVCFIAVSCAVPIKDEHEREKRSSSNESNQRVRFQPPFFPYIPSINPNPNPNPNINTNNMLNLLLPLLLGRLASAPTTGK